MKAVGKLLPNRFSFGAGDSVPSENNTTITIDVIPTSPVKYFTKYLCTHNDIVD